MKYWFLETSALALRFLDPDGDHAVNRLLHAFRETNDNFVYASPLAEMEIIYSLRVRGSVQDIPLVPRLIEELFLKGIRRAITATELKEATRLVSEGSTDPRSAIHQANFQELSNLLKLDGSTSTINCLSCDNDFVQFCLRQYGLSVFNPRTDSMERYEVMWSMP